MSAAAVKQVIARAAAEPAYQQLLLEQPDVALADYPLTGVELAVLTSLTAESFDAPAAQLDPRVSHAAAPSGSPAVAIVDLGNTFQSLGSLVGSAGASNAG